MRFWEMFPGLTVWGTFLLAISLSFFLPLWVIVFIIVFDLLWLFRVLYFNIFVLISWRRYKKADLVDWQAKLFDIDGTENIHHLIFLPTYKEGYDIIKGTLRSLRESPFPSRKMIVVLGGEQGDEQAFNRYVDRAKKEFGNEFLRLFTTMHPKT